MPDYFALLKEPRKPWLEPEAVQSKFLALSGRVHPDRVHQAPAPEREDATQLFSELNAACQCLRHSKERVRHLLELERGARLELLERLPSSDADEYFELGQVCRDVDRFLIEKNASVSPLLQVRVFERAMEWRERLAIAQAALSAKIAVIESELQNLNPAWEAAPPVGDTGRAVALPLSELERLYRRLSYAVRWSEQLRDRVVRLVM